MRLLLTFATGTDISNMDMIKNCGKNSRSNLEIDGILLPRQF